MKVRSRIDVADTRKNGPFLFIKRRIMSDNFYRFVATSRIGVGEIMAGSATGRFFLFCEKGE